MGQNIVTTAETSSMCKTIIGVIGPTAIGKTALAIELARHFKTDIISADSRQFYKEMRIGTAVPSAEELAEATQHFIQHISIEDTYSVGDFERQALEKLNWLFQSQDRVIMAGGSGLYVNAVIHGLDEFPEVDPAIRASLNEQLKNSGIQILQEQLKALDPLYYSEVDKENPHRLIRALEVSMGTGRPYSTFRKNKQKERDFRSVLIGLTADRETIYRRIDQRVDIMMAQGLLEEVRGLANKRHLNALNTVGYKELFEHLEGKTSLDDAIAEIKKNTRRFAKRQLTWFKRNENVKWFDFRTPTEEIIEYLIRY